jgi:GntR family transcriptional regulator
LHRQIHDLVRQEIVTDRLPPGSRLPSEEDLAERWGVSLAPVRQALVDLAAEGYLDRGRGRGTFVRQSKFEEKLSILASFSGSHGQSENAPSS